MDVGISFSNPTSAGLQGFKQETSFKGEQSVSLSFFLVLVCLCLRYIYVKASTASHQSSGQLWVQVLAQGHFKRGGWERAKCHLPHPHFPIWSWYSRIFFFLFKPPGFSHLVKQQGQLGLFEHAYSDKNKVYSEILNTQEKLSMQLQNMIQPTAKKKKQQKSFIHLFYLFFINLLLYCILCIFSLSFGATCFHSRPTGFLCLRTETLVPLLPSFAQII